MSRHFRLRSELSGTITKILVREKIDPKNFDTFNHPAEYTFMNGISLIKVIKIVTYVCIILISIEY